MHAALFFTVCFKVFDIDRDGVLNFDEIKEMINILICVAKESSTATIFKNVTADNVLNELYDRVSNKTSSIQVSIGHLFLLLISIFIQNII